MVDVVPAALLAESPEVAQVLAYLCRRHAQPDTQLLGADDLDVVGLEATEHPDILGQPLYNYIWDFIIGRSLG